MLEVGFYTTMILFLVVCVFMILLVLIQKGRGGGLASAFGGAGGNTAFGSKTGDVLTWATSIVFGVFLVLAVLLNILATQRHQDRVGVAAGDAPVQTDAQPQRVRDPVVPLAPTTSATDGVAATPPASTTQPAGLEIPAPATGPSTLPG